MYRPLVIYGFIYLPTDLDNLSPYGSFYQGEVNCQPVKELFGEGIFVADGENWKEQRRVASYEFSSSTLRDFSTNVFREYVLKLVSLLALKAKDGEAFDMQVSSYCNSASTPFLPAIPGLLMDVNYWFWMECAMQG